MHVRLTRAVGAALEARPPLLTFLVLPISALLASVLLAPVALSPSGAAAADATEPPGRDSPGRRITLRTPEHPVAVGARVTLSGRVPGQRRRVLVQRRSRWGEWHTIARSRTDRRGRFTLRVRARVPGRVLLRSLAPAHRGRPAVRSAPRAVDAVRQRGSIAAIPPLSGPGRDPAVPTEAAQVLLTFTPPLPGREVGLERHGARGWRRVDSGRQNLSGTVAFAARPGARYRGVAGPGVRTEAVTARAFDLQFAEDFSAPGPDGRSPDPARWIDQPRPNAAGRTCSVNDPRVRSVSGGVLHLRVAPDPRSAGPACSYPHQGEVKTSPRLLNSQVATARSFSFTHGYAAARIKMHSHPGAHGAFWLLPSKTVPDGAPDWHDVSFVHGNPSRGAEVDIVEYWANASGPQREPAVGSFVHWYDAAGEIDSWGYLFPEADDMRRPGDTWDDTFHVFSVRWTPQEYVFMVDGQVYARHSGAVSQVPQYVVLSLLAGDYELDRVRPPLFADSVQVDWVRVWGL